MAHREPDNDGTAIEQLAFAVQAESRAFTRAIDYWQSGTWTDDEFLQDIKQALITLNHRFDATGAEM